MDGWTEGWVDGWRKLDGYLKYIVYGSGLILTSGPPCLLFSVIFATF
jgi:hypothetical protein